jgi:hypothetical protein
MLSWIGDALPKKSVETFLDISYASVKIGSVELDVVTVSALDGWASARLTNRGGDGCPANRTTDVQGRSIEHPFG